RWPRATMPGFQMRSQDRSRDLPAILSAAAGSLLLSAAAVARASAVNNDGARYLAAAEAYARSGLDGALQVYPWPFYSVLVALLCNLTRGTLAAAHFLDAAGGGRRRRHRLSVRVARAGRRLSLPAWPRVCPLHPPVGAHPGAPGQARARDRPRAGGAGRGRSGHAPRRGRRAAHAVAGR